MNCDLRLDRLRQKTAFFDRWLRSPWYVPALALLTVISNLLRLDLGIYTLFMALGIWICLFGSDLLPLMPIFILCYVAPSRENNPGRYPESVFYPQNGGIFLILLLLLWATCLIWRLVKDPELGGKSFLKTKRSLLPSMLLLGAAYLLSGIGMDEYFSIMGQNLIFALIQCFAVIALYYLFTGSVRWDRVPRGYYSLAYA